MYEIYKMEKKYNYHLGNKKDEQPSIVSCN